jgi:hypothetical protein
MTPPWGVPSLLFLPPLIVPSSSLTGVLSHILISFSTRLSVIRCSRSFISLSWGMVSKYELKSASYTWSYPLFRCSRIVATACPADRRGETRMIHPESQLRRLAQLPACMPFEPPGLLSLVFPAVASCHSPSGYIPS